MRDFILDDADRAFRTEIRDFLACELAPRAADIEDRDDWNAVKDVVSALACRCSGYAHDSAVAIVVSNA